MNNNTTLSTFLSIPLTNIIFYLYVESVCRIRRSVCMPGLADLKLFSNFFVMFLKLYVIYLEVTESNRVCYTRILYCLSHTAIKRYTLNFILLCYIFHIPYVTCSLSEKYQEKQINKSKGWIAKQILKNIFYSFFNNHANPVANAELLCASSYN